MSIHMRPPISAPRLSALLRGSLEQELSGRDAQTTSGFSRWHPCPLSRKYQNTDWRARAQKLFSLMIYFLPFHLPLKQGGHESIERDPNIGATKIKLRLSRSLYIPAKTLFILNREIPARFPKKTSSSKMIFLRLSSRPSSEHDRIRNLKYYTIISDPYKLFINASHHTSTLTSTAIINIF